MVQWGDYSGIIVRTLQTFELVAYGLWLIHLNSHTISLELISLEACFINYYCGYLNHAELILEAYLAFTVERNVAADIRCE